MSRATSRTTREDVATHAMTGDRRGNEKERDRERTRRRRGGAARTRRARAHLASMSAPKNATTSSEGEGRTRRSGTTSDASTSTSTSRSRGDGEEETNSNPRYDEEGNVHDAFIGKTTCEIEEDDESGMTRVTLYTWDRTGLMADLGNALNSMGLSVRSAVLKSDDKGVVTCNFVVSTFLLRAMADNDYETLKARLEASAMRRGNSSRWMQRQRRLKELFRRIDTRDIGYISQSEIEQYAKTLRMPTSFVHDFIAEGDSSGGDGFMDFESFAAFVRSKEVALRGAFDSLDPDENGFITGKQLKSGLRDLELRSGRYNSRKKLRKKGLDAILEQVDDDSRLSSDDFRDLLVLMPTDSLKTVSPYYMKVGLDIGPRRLAIPDRRKEGSPWGHLLAGGAAGIVAKTVSSPLNVLAVRTATSTAEKAPGLVRMFKGILRDEGVRGLFKGNFSNSMSSAPGKAIDFFAYNAYKNLLTQGESREPTNFERLCAGAMAGITSDTLLYPLEVISNRLSVNPQAYKNSFVAASSVVKKVGLKGLYSGWGTAMIGTIPYTGLSFGTYDILSNAYKKAMNKETAGVGPTLLCGVASGFLASTASYPIYQATVRLQTGLMPLGANGKPLSLANSLVMTVRDGGAKALFRGWVPSSLKIVPQAGASFLVYELVKKELMKQKKNTDACDDWCEEEKPTGKSNQNDS